MYKYARGIGVVDANDVSGGTPAREHARTWEAGEDTDERRAAGGGHVLAGGIVTHVEPAGGDDRGKARERASPAFHGGSSGHAGLGDGTLDALGFFASRALIDGQGLAGSR